MPVDREIESRRCVLFILIPVHFQPTEVGNEKEVKEVCTTMYTYLYVCWPSCVYIHVHVHVYMYQGRSVLLIMCIYTAYVYQYVYTCIYVYTITVLTSCIYVYTITVLSFNTSLNSCAVRTC